MSNSRQDRQVSHFRYTRNNGPEMRRRAAAAEPMQILREIVKNAMEADATDITLSVCFANARRALAETGQRVNKLAVIDNGKGMSREEMIFVMERIGESGGGKINSLEGNQGQGLINNGAALNPEGIDILSYQNGEGWMVRIGADGEGNYGLVFFENEDGMTDASVPVPDWLEEEYGREHGTIVIFHGEEPTSNTYPLPGTTAFQMLRYLQAKFLDLPEGVDIRVFHPPFHNGDWPLNANELERGRTQYRNVKGVRYYMDKYCAASGVCRLQGASLLWWTFGDHTEGSSPHARAEDKAASNSYKTGSTVGVCQGFVGLVYQGEIYNLSRKHYKLSMFGIHSQKARQRMAFLIIPDVETVFPNSERSNLLFKNAQDYKLPWSQWSADFRAEIPAAVQKVLDETAVLMGTGDISKEVAKFLEPLQERMGTSLMQAGKGTRINKGPRKGSGGGHKKGSNNSLSRPLYPTFKAVDDLNPTRPARYVKETNDLLVFVNHALFKSTVDRFLEDFGVQDDAEEDGVRSTVFRVFCEELGQAVLTSLADIRKRELKTLEERAARLSDEALWTAVGRPLTLEARIARILRGKFNRGIRKA